jgi:uncharacterized protein YyaL (SSP411 family)
MDATPEEIEQRLDKAYETMKQSLAKEEGGFGEAAKAYEAMYDEILKDFRKTDPQELHRPLTAGEMMLASQAASTMARVYRLGERMTKELEWLYASNYYAFKNTLRIEKGLPDKAQEVAEKIVENYQKGTDERTKSMVKDAVKFTINQLFEPQDTFEEKREKRNDTRESG